MQEKEGNEIDTVMSSYYGEEQVTAIINLKVDTKAADTIAEKVANTHLSKMSSWSPVILTSL